MRRFEDGAYLAYSQIGHDKEIFSFNLTVYFLSAQKLYSSKQKGLSIVIDVFSTQLRSHSPPFRLSLRVSAVLKLLCSDFLVIRNSPIKAAFERGAYLRVELVRVSTVIFDFTRTT